MALHDMGKTAEGRTQWMAIVTSPENHKKLARYKEISRRLALAEGLTDDQARALAKEGKAVVWIDGGLHATETLGAQQLGADGLRDGQPHRRRDDAVPQRLHHPVRPRQPGRQRSRRRLVHAQPEPGAAVARPACRASTRSTSATTTTATSSPRRSPRPRTSTACCITSGSRRFSTTTTRAARPAPSCGRSPQRDPYNYNLDPLLVLGLQALGTHMHQRLAAEGKPGATMASGGAYDGWWNGGIRNTGNFHNIIAILTETIGSPTPMRIPLVPQRQIPNRDLPYPDRAAGVALQAVGRLLDVVQPRRARLRVAQPREPALQHLPDGAALDRARQRRLLDGVAVARSTPSPDDGRRRPGRPTPEARQRRRGRQLRKPELRDPRAYIIPSDQRDFPTAVKFINALREVNVAVHRATAAFQANGKSYPAGSFVVMTNQAFRPHVIDMFEPQDHPNVIPYPGAPPTPPVRQRRLDARVPDGRAVRSHARALHRAVREGDRLERQAAGRDRIAATGEHRHVRPRRERRVHRGEPAAEGRAARSAERPGLRRRSPTPRLLKALDAAGHLVQTRDRRHQRSRCARRASGCGTSTADRWNPAGRAGFSSSSSSRSPASSRRSWTPAT